jgi:hypothetical protein
MSKYNFIMNEGEKKAALEKAITYERMGEYNWAAAYYEDLARGTNEEEFFDKAREMKDKERGLNLRITSVNTSVNINEMLRQLRDSGVAVSYKCPNCSAVISVKEKNEMPSNCSYCGSKFDKVDLPDILRAALH